LTRALAFALYVVLYAALNTSGLLLLRAGLRDSADRSSVTATAADTRVVAGLALYALGFVAWILTLRRSQLSLVYPIFVGVSYVSVIAASALFLHERITMDRLIGIVLIGVGVALVVR
jgi:drug/metabolite transporter (DMT)-like permease